MCLDLWTAVAIFLYFCEIDSMSVNINFCRFAVAGRSSGVRRTVPAVLPPSPTCFISHLLPPTLASQNARACGAKRNAASQIWKNLNTVSTCTQTRASCDAWQS